MIKPDVILGDGKTIVTDVTNTSEGWAGIVFSEHPAKTGEWVKVRANTDEDFGPRVRIISDRIESLDVVISALERAKKALEESPANG